MGKNEIRLLITGGTDKSGEPEAISEVAAGAGDVIALAGVAGAGKSRLLTDIEWLSKGESPTARHVRFYTAQGDEGDDPYRYVTRISQNMMYHLDMRVAGFLELYAESAGLDDGKEKIRETLDWSNRLSGEPFAGSAPLSELSGGQARALMISETAVMSPCPVVLIDEIENAGINRFDSMELLADSGKITLLATHDPALALMAQRRIVLANGGMRSIHSASQEEKKVLDELMKYNARIESARDRIRRGLPPSD